MKSNPKTVQIGAILILTVFLSSCMKTPAPEKSGETNAMADIVTTPQQPTLPVQYQTAPYILDQPKAEEAQLDEETILKVGARITSTRGPQPLWDIVKRLVALKRMNVSWASDVDKDTLVDVDISPDDDFYQALDNMLRQVDYFHETSGNTIIIKYRETRQFQIAMPFTRQTYSTAVGGNLLGSSGSDSSGGSGGSGGKQQMEGVVNLKSTGNTFDLWENIKSNLDTILNIWEIGAQETIKRNSKINDLTKNQDTTEYNHKKNSQNSDWNTQSQGQIVSTTQKGETEIRQEKKRNENAKGFYIIDKPVGIITVTAPRTVLDKIETYITKLKGKLYKQISIEAKIIEVQLDNESNIGINWNSVFKNFKLMAGTLAFGANGQVYPQLKNSIYFRDKIYTDRTGNDLQPPQDDSSIRYYHNATTGAAFYDAINPGQFISKITLNAASFETFLNALKEEGKTKILSNPKISVMNGQPAMITVGQNRTYINEVKVEVDTKNNTRTYSATTDRLLAGVGMALTATILDNREIIMNLIPITSELVGNDIPYEYYGENGEKVGVPIINVREMSTTVKVGDGEMLVIGGLISDAESKDEHFVPILGDIPGIRYLFGYEKKKRKKRELIILLRPKII